MCCVKKCANYKYGHFHGWQAIKYIEYDSSFGDKEKQQAEELKVTCNLNDAACKLKSRTTNRQRSCAQRLGYEIFYSS
jgi:hypothetical protein